MRISDWSSDVCSSDLGEIAVARTVDGTCRLLRRLAAMCARDLHRYLLFGGGGLPPDGIQEGLRAPVQRAGHVRAIRAGVVLGIRDQDRKSTRLNSSH